MPGLPSVAIMAEAVSCSAIATAAIRGALQFLQGCSHATSHLPTPARSRREDVARQPDLGEQVGIPIVRLDREAL
ncbi:MAG: hypothetical protein R2855_03120 [Thermomicrobiales bacterium]